MESIACPFLRSSVCEEAQRRLDQTGLASEEGTLEKVAGIEAFEHAIDKTGPGDPRQSLRRQRGQAEANLDLFELCFDEGWKPGRGVREDPGPPSASPGGGPAPDHAF